MVIFKDVSAKKALSHADKVHVPWEDYHVPLYGFSVGQLHSQPFPCTLSEKKSEQWKWYIIICYGSNEWLNHLYMYA